jgi:hypothetical protein
MEIVGTGLAQSVWQLSHGLQYWEFLVHILARTTEYYHRSSIQTGSVAHPASALRVQEILCQAVKRSELEAHKERRAAVFMLTVMPSWRAQVYPYIAKQQVCIGPALRCTKVIGLTSPSSIMQCNSAS